jgi:hypothetical protein
VLSISYNSFLSFFLSSFGSFLFLSLPVMGAAPPNPPGTHFARVPRPAHKGVVPRHHACASSGSPISASVAARGDPDDHLATARGSRATSAPGIGILQKSAQNLEIPDGEKSPGRQPRSLPQARAPECRLLCQRVPPAVRGAVLLTVPHDYGCWGPAHCWHGFRPETWHDPGPSGASALNCFDQPRLRRGARCLPV